MAHAQRDVWMALPVVAAVLLRVRRATSEDVSCRRSFCGAVLEGALWGAAVWIKPHCALMAVGVWMITAWRVSAVCSRRGIGFAADLLGNVPAVSAIGLAGIVWLVGTGAVA